MFTDGTVMDEHYEKVRELFQPYFDEAGLPPSSFSSRLGSQLQVVLDLGPKVFSYMFGTLPPEMIDQYHKRGIKTIGAATTLDEALALEATGMDIIIASGFESGGQRPSFLSSAESSITGTFVLTQLIKEKVKAPLIAAGGIANGSSIAAALTQGAEAVQIGTAFLACEESSIQ
ncbi:MAG TPA: nitronate monooxygenase [Flavisolibacter sp.]|jgi:nitronate monooxygenase|nr:nitronate monooxygenase [Flavisolibacter sp.]